MKDEPVHGGKKPRDQFVAFGQKVMSVAKEEIDARDKRWHASKRRKKKRVSHG